MNLSTNQKHGEIENICNDDDPKYIQNAIEMEFRNSNHGDDKI